MKQSTYEVYRLDHIEDPDDTVGERLSSPAENLIHVTITGRYKEGAHFNIAHSGFATYSLRLTLGGQGKMQYRGQLLTLKRGDIILTNNYEPLSMASNDDEWVFSYFNMVGSPLVHYEELWNQGGVEIIHTENPDVFEDLRNQVKLAMRQPGLKADLEINLILTRILSMLLIERERAKPPNPDGVFPAWVSEAAEYIAANYRDRDKISAVADRFFVNRAHFSRLFKKYTGKTPKEYQTICRMNEAAMLLQGTTLPMVEIASRTGFVSQSLFTKVFHRVYGQTPTEYRKNGARHL